MVVVARQPVSDGQMVRKKFGRQQGSGSGVDSDSTRNQHGAQCEPDLRDRNLPRNWQDMPIPDRAMDLIRRRLKPETVAFPDSHPAARKLGAPNRSHGATKQVLDVLKVYCKA